MAAADASDRRLEVIIESLDAVDVPGGTT